MGTALDKVNVRWLVNHLTKFLDTHLKPLVFENFGEFYEYSKKTAHNYVQLLNIDSCYDIIVQEDKDNRAIVLALTIKE
jgi:hypothetical protein